MKTKLKSFYKKIDKTHPVIGSLMRRIHIGKLFNNVRRRIRGSGNTITSKSAILSNVTFDIDGNNNTIEIKEGCVLSNLTFYIRGDNHTLLIMSHCTYQKGLIWFEDENCSLVIGERSTFADVHLALTEPGSKIYIGQDCMFSTDIDVRTGDSHSIISRETGARINYAQNVFIGDHVWIAAHSVLLKGTKIAQDSIVASGSVVTRKFETPGIIIGGNPSIQIREGITWSRERISRKSADEPQ